MRIKNVNSKDVTGQESVTEGLYMTPWGLFFGNLCPYDPDNHAFNVITESPNSDFLIHKWYVEKHMA
jgi:hypothetical protein